MGWGAAGRSRTCKGGLEALDGDGDGMGMQMGWGWGTAGASSRAGGAGGEQVQEQPRSVLRMKHQHHPQGTARGDLPRLGHIPEGPNPRKSRGR